MVQVNPVTQTFSRLDGTGCSGSNSPAVNGDMADWSYSDPNTLYAATRGSGPPVINKYVWGGSSWGAPTEITNGNLNVDCAPLAGKLGPAHPAKSGTPYAPLFGGAAFSLSNINVTPGSNPAVKVTVAFYTGTGSMFQDSPPTPTITVTNWSSYTITNPDVPSPADATIIGYKVYSAPTTTTSHGWLVDTEASPTWGSPNTSASIATSPTSGAVIQSCGVNTAGCSIFEGSAMDDRYNAYGYGAAIGGLGQDYDSVFAIAEHGVGCTVLDFGHLIQYFYNGSTTTSTPIAIINQPANQGTSIHKVKFFGNNNIVLTTNGSTGGGVAYINPSTGAGYMCSEGSPCYGNDHNAIGYNWITSQMRNATDSEFEPLTRTNPIAGTPPYFTSDFNLTTWNYLGIDKVFNFGPHMSGSFDNNDNGLAVNCNFISNTPGYLHPTEGEVSLFHVNTVNPTVYRVGRHYAATISEGTNPNGSGFRFTCLCNMSEDVQVIAFHSGMLDAMGKDCPNPSGSCSQTNGARVDVFAYLMQPTTGNTPIVSLSVPSVSFVGGSIYTPTTITLTNSGSGSMTNLSIGTTGNFVATTTCSSTLNALASCNISIVSTTKGTYTGTLVITSNASTSPNSYPLSTSGVGATALSGNIMVKGGTTH